MRVYHGKENEHFEYLNKEECVQKIYCERKKKSICILNRDGSAIDLKILQVVAT